MQKLSQNLTSLFFALSAFFMNISAPVQNNNFEYRSLQIESSSQSRGLPGILHLNTNPKKSVQRINTYIIRGLASGEIKKENLELEKNKKNLKISTENTDYSKLDPNLYEVDQTGRDPIMQLEVIQGELER